MPDPTLADTNGDSLNDRWEVNSNGSSGVSPTVAAISIELSSDTDGDSLNLLEEGTANKNPDPDNNPVTADGNNYTEQYGHKYFN